MGHGTETGMTTKITSAGIWYKSLNMMNNAGALANMLTAKTANASLGRVIEWEIGRLRLQLNKPSNWFRIKGPSHWIRNSLPNGTIRSGSPT